VETITVDAQEEKGHSKKETDFKSRGLQIDQTIWNFGKRDRFAGIEEVDR